MSGPSPKHGQALETDTDDQALLASGPAPKHGSAAALSIGAAGATEDGAVEPESGSQEVSV
ncbi:MAG: hypothetical protein ACJ74Z_11330 [Bryobacteraceae bacterium]|jgi:hypothetical protein